jgi:hypothetical protein
MTIMNVTAFIRKTSAKDKATIYFRVRDEKCDQILGGHFYLEVCSILYH